MKSSPTEASRPDRAAALVITAVVAAAPRRYPSGLRAIVLTGSLARDEGTFAVQGGQSVCLGDAEFLLVFHQGARLPSRRETSFLARNIEADLMRQGISIPVDLSPVDTAYLEGLPPHIYGYELRTLGRVVWGDPVVLALIPGFEPADIPLADAWNLLMNRMVELVEVCPDIAGAPERLPDRVCYRTVKLYLDMATSLLLFAGSYAPGYRVRRAILLKLEAHSGGDREWPFPLGRFARAVDAATEWKLNPLGAELDASKRFLLSAIDCVQALCSWELARLTGRSPAEPLPALISRWRARQLPAARWRGWAYAARSTGWHRGWRHWPRWLAMAPWGSPRMWIYGAAAELCGFMPGMVRDRSGDVGAEQLARLSQQLPLRERADGRDGVSIAQAIGRNYRELLEGTRA